MTLPPPGRDKYPDLLQFFEDMLQAAGLPFKVDNYRSFGINGSFGVGNGSSYNNFIDPVGATYAALTRKNVWYVGNLWISPYVSSYTSGTSAVSTNIVSQNASFGAVEFIVDNRTGLVAADTSLPSRMFFESIMMTAIKATNNNANSTYTLPYLFSGYQIFTK